MTRIPEVERGKAGLLARLVYFVCKRRFGKVLTPLAVTAHHPRLLRSVLHMETGQEAANSVPVQLKMLAQVKVAMQIGCPF